MHHEQKTLACREQGYIGTLYDLERTQVMLPCVRSEHRRRPIRAYGGGIACVRYTSYEPYIPLILAR